MQQILTNLKLGQSPPTFSIFTSKCNATRHVDAYASGYVFFNVSGGEHVLGPFVCFYWCFPDCLQGNVFTFCRNWWVWCLWHWKYALRKITGRARWPDLLVFNSLFWSLKAYFSYYGAPTYDFHVIKTAVNTH